MSAAAVVPLGPEVETEQSPVASAMSPSSRLRLSVPVSQTVQIDASEFVQLVSSLPAPLDGSFGSDSVVLDVRPAESFVGGHVRGSVHVPFSEEAGEIPSVDEVLAKIQKAGTRRVVVLDSGARQQAPVVAELLLQKLKESSSAADKDDVSVLVLTSGFSGVLNEHVSISADRASVSLKAGAEALIADFNSAHWLPVQVPRTPSNASMPQSTNMLVYKQQVDAANVLVAASPKAQE